MDCGALMSRYDFQEQLATLNPETAAYAAQLLERKNARQARQRALAAGSVANTTEAADDADDVRCRVTMPPSMYGVRYVFAATHITFGTTSLAQSAGT
jgi:sRNA-binding protein